MAVLLTRRGTLQAKVEANYGVAETVGLDDGLLISEPAFEVDPNLLERDILRDTLSPLPIIIGRKLARMTFTAEIRGNGIQNSGDAADAPIISRLLRACGYSLTAVPTPEAKGPYAIDFHPTQVTWAVDDAALTNTRVETYWIEVVTGGASGVAEVEITSNVESLNNVTSAPVTEIVTSGTPLNIGTTGLAMTPTFTQDLVVGMRWVVWVLPTGLRLDPVSDNFESVTIVMNKDGVKHTMPGAFGTFDIEAEAGNYGRINFEFTGIYVDPVDEPLPSGLNYETALPPQVEYARLRCDDFYAIVNRFTYDQGNDIQVRPDVSSKEGYIGIRIVARTPEGGIDPEADLVANYDFWGRMARATRMPFQMRVGTVDGNQVWFFAPNTQYSGLTYADRNGIMTYDAGLRFAGFNGDDEMTIFLC